MIKNMGTIIILDEEKILKEGKNIDDLYKYLDEVALKTGLIRIDKNHYACKGDKEDLFWLDEFTTKVMENQTITKNLLEWYWLENGKLDSNIIEEAKEEGIGVWE